MAEPVCREDVEKEVEYMEQAAISLADFYHRAKIQGAPVELLNEMALVWQDVEKARQRLEKLIPCFPPEAGGVL